MAQNKHERGLNFFSTLSDDTARETAKYLSLKDIAALARVSESSRLLFQPILNDAKAVHPLLAAVVTGDPDALCLLVNADPALLFTKGQIKDPAGQVFYDVSPYQLMIFLCDDDMKSRIMPFTRLSEQMARKRQVQYAEINIGGADLVKMDRDPMLLPFEDITRFTTSYVFMGQRKEVTYPLLENPDGILYYKNPTSNQAQFYYANQDTRTVACIEPRIHSQQEQAALDRLEDSLADMEDLSSRRLSNDEHKFIESIMQHTLVRKGLQYERDGVRYCDHRIEFRIVHAYRQCLRLYRNNQWDVGDV